MNVAEHLLARERERCDALARGDVAALRELLWDGYVHVHANGRTEGRETLLAALAGGPPRHTERGDLRVAAWGEAALMSGPLATTIEPVGERPGHRIVGVATQAWALVEGRWLLASFQLTPTQAIERLESGGSGR